MNTSGVFMTDLSQQNIVDKQKAELYMQLYPYASEDFLSSMDATNYSEVIALHINNVHKELERLMQIISKHTHNIPPHGHSVVGHSTALPVPLTTLVPIQSSTIKWTVVKCPTVQNTTGSSWNLAGNFKVTGLPSEGMLITSERRALPLPLTLTITLPPIYTAGLI